MPQVWRTESVARCGGGAKIAAPNRLSPVCVEGCFWGAENRQHGAALFKLMHGAHTAIARPSKR